VAALRNRADIVVTRPRRLADLIGQGHCHLGDVEAVVLDDAEQMADLGFVPVVRRLLETPPKASGCCSRPPSTVRWTSWRGVSWGARRGTTWTPPRRPGRITHHLLTVTPAERAAVVATLASSEGRVLIFTWTRHGAHKLVRQLTTAGRQRRNPTATRRRAHAGTSRRADPARSAPWSRPTSRPAACMRTASAW
jgi:superfamily II DNA/RNA helicase